MNLNRGRRGSTFCPWQLDEKTGLSAYRDEMCAALLCFSLPLLFGFSSAFAQPRSGNLYWAPPNYTAGGEQIDSILYFIFWLTLFVFVAVQAVSGHLSCQVSPP